MAKLLNVYLTDLNAYNNGYLRGEWLELPMSEDELKEAIERIAPNGHEYFISDCESSVGIEAGEYEDVEKLNEIIDELESKCKDDSDYKKLEAIIERDGVNLDRSGSIKELMEHMKNDTFYEGYSAEEYIDEYLSSSGMDFSELGWIGGYITIDYERAVKDSDSIYEAENGVLINCMY